jgi:bifunctional DNase/RNase
MKKKIELEVAEILNRMPSDLALVILLREKGGTRCLPVLVGPLEAQAEP